MALFGKPQYSTVTVKKKDIPKDLWTKCPKTGEIIWGYEGRTHHVHGQAMIGDLTDEYPGIECYAGEAKGGFHPSSTEASRPSSPGTRRRQ